VCIFAPDLERIAQVSMEGKAMMDGEGERERESARARAHTHTHERVCGGEREGERESEREQGEKEEGLEVGEKRKEEKTGRSGDVKCNVAR
jgi:hypothetical protein